MTEGSRDALARVRRVVVKIGTNVIMQDDGTPALSRIYGLIESVAKERRNGREILLVSSGAVGLGAQRLRLAEKPRRLELKQACAAVGQSRLMALYEEGFERLGLLTAQVLLTEDDFISRARYLNLKATLEKLLDLGAVPVLNENDVVSTSELETPPGASRQTVFGDNDRLSALVASKMEAGLLVVLSDVDALYTANPTRKSDAVRVPVVPEVTPEIEAYAEGGGARGRGGMQTKLAAARIATSAGGYAVIASGREPFVLDRLLKGDDLGTLFLPVPKSTALRGRKRWLAFATATAGTVVVNEGAFRELRKGRASLLLVGVTRVSGHFRRGDVVSLCAAADGSGPEIEFARGIANFGSDEAVEILALLSKAEGGASEPGAGPVRKARGQELVTRDNIVLTGTEGEKERRGS